MSWHRRNRAALATMGLWLVPVVLVCSLTRKAVAIATSAAILVVVVAAFILIALSILRDVADRNNATVATLIVFYLSTIIVLFANLYRWTGLIYPAGFTNDPHAFWTALYFSTVTWTTLGYGDVLPGVNSRGIAAAEALTGYVAMALLIALISAMIQRR